MTAHDHAVRPSGPQRTDGAARDAGRDTAGAGRQSAGQDRSRSVPQLVGLQRTAGNRAVAAQKGPPVRSPLTVQRDSAATLIDKHTFLGMLDEEDLAADLAGALPGNTGVVNSVLDLLPTSDQDNVVGEIRATGTRARSPARHHCVPSLAAGVVP